jgi:hypothetical protein
VDHRAGGRIFHTTPISPRAILPDTILVSVHNEIDPEESDQSFMKLFLRLSGMALLFLIATGCGDTFRPIIIPNPPTFPDPRAAHTVMSINDNGTTNPGTAMVVDVSGDSIVGVAKVGVAPVHAVQQSASQVLVVNHATTTSGADSLSKINFSGTTINGTPAVISLPPNSAPNFVATTESNQAYVLLPNYFDPVASATAPSVGVVNTVSNQLIATVPVGNTPWAMVETLDRSKLYVANKGDGTISAFNTLDRSARAITGSLSSPPIWLSARSDSQRVFVLESSGALASLDTSTSAGPDTLSDPQTIIVPGATQMTYDGHLNRLYIAGGTSAAVVDVSQSTPQLLATVNLTPVSPSSRSAQDPCAVTVVTTLSAFRVTTLPDGTRAYVGAYYEDASGNICPQVTVINASSNAVKTTIAVPGFVNFDSLCATTRFRFAMAAAGDSSRAYLSACDGGNISVIDTANDTYLVGLAAPFSARPPIPPNPQPPPQNPVFLIAGP